MSVEEAVGRAGTRGMETKLHMIHVIYMVQYGTVHYQYGFGQVRLSNTWLSKLLAPQAIYIYIYLRHFFEVSQEPKMFLTSKQIDCWRLG